MAVVVREAQLADIDRLAVINIAAWQTAYAGVVPTAYLEAMELDDYAERWRVGLSQPSTVSRLVAELDGTLASYAVAGPYRVQQDATPEDVGGWGELCALYTDPGLQGLGAGSAVHERALARLRSDGFRTAALWVLEGNKAARSWYAARGWQPDGATSRWLAAGEPLTEVRLRREL